MNVSSSTARYNKSCQFSHRYPLNLAYRVSNNGSLAAHSTLLGNNSQYLFYSKSNVKVLELKNNENPLHSAHLKTLKSDDDFATCFPQPRDDGTTPASTVRCRFIFFQAESGQAKLDVSLLHAQKVLTYFQVMPSYIDFMAAFTKKRMDEEDVSDLRFSSFRESIRLSSDEGGLDLPHLAISGHGYQLSYNLKSVANKSRERASWNVNKDAQDTWNWSIRQAAFHHQFDTKEGTSLWIITSARNYIQERVRNMTGQTEASKQGANLAPGHDLGDELDSHPRDRTFTTAEDSFIASLSVHLMLAQYASEDWKGYIRWLEQMIEKKTKRALRDASFDPTTFELIYVQEMEDKINKAVLTLEANGKVLKSLQQFYSNLMGNEDFELRKDKRSRRAIADFNIQLRNYIDDTGMITNRATALAKIAADRKSLVQQHQQARATDRVEKLTIQQQQEAKIMRVIAVLTLIYLPATFSSTFFSTDIVKYQQDGDGPADYYYASYSGLALERWFEVTIPLTIITFAVAASWYYWWDPLKNIWQDWRTKDFTPTVIDVEKTIP